MKPEQATTPGLSDRRDFVRRVAIGGILAAAVGPTIPAEETRPPVSAPPDNRAYWRRMMRRVCEPVLAHLAAGTLRAQMPVEAPTAPADQPRGDFSHLEAFGRTVAGIAPWLELEEAAGGETEERARFRDLLRRGLDQATNPASPDCLNFTRGGQPLVDAAFLAYGLLLARKSLWDPLPADVKSRVIAALQSTRGIASPNNNWLLFPAMIETFCAVSGASWREDAVDRAVQTHESWYKGDGVYGDGPEFHWDYYNSYVIQPFLGTILRALQGVTDRWESHLPRILRRAVRYAAVQERLIGPDGTFPPLGRSLSYRCGAFHHLAHQAFRNALPPGVAPAEVRSALTAVMRRTLEAEGTFDAGGWLRVGLAGHQPSLAEPYISTGSLYLCSLVFQPLGLPAAHPFWRDPPADWAQRRLWAGVDLPADHALKES